MQSLKGHKITLIAVLDLLGWDNVEVRSSLETAVAETVAESVAKPVSVWSMPIDSSDSQPPGL